MSRDHNTYRARSLDLDHDEEFDYQMALKVSAEINGESSAHPTNQSDYDADAEFARAMQLAFDDELQTADQNDFTPNTGSYALGVSAAPFSGPSRWEQDDLKIAEYQPETPSKQTITRFADFVKCLNSGKCKCGEHRFRSEP